MKSVLTLYGDRGEGGGQILRSALALSLATGRPFVLERIRAGRKKPGLLRQHLAAVRLAARVGDARVDGAALGATRLGFAPRALHAGSHRIAVGTAGSTALVAEAVLPALLFAGKPSELVIEGGTHARSAPPFEFLDLAWARVLRDHGAALDLTLERHGFFPAGGGRLRVRVEPWTSPGPVTLLERGARVRTDALALTCRLPGHVAARELAVVTERLGWERGRGRTVVCDAPCPGNAVIVVIEHAHVTEVFTAFGSQGVRAEAVAKEACEAVERWIVRTEPVGPHLADQLMLPLALGPGGRYRTHGLTPHARTNLEVIEAFLPGATAVEESPDGAVDVVLRGGGAGQ